MPLGTYSRKRSRRIACVLLLILTANSPALGNFYAKLIGEADFLAASIPVWRASAKLRFSLAFPPIFSQNLSFCRVFCLSMFLASVAHGWISTAHLTISPSLLLLTTSHTFSPRSIQGFRGTRRDSGADTRLSPRLSPFPG